MSKRLDDRTIPAVFITKHVAQKLVAVLERASVYDGGAHMTATRGADGVKRYGFGRCKR